MREVEFRAWKLKDDGEDVFPTMINHFELMNYTDFTKEAEEGNIILMQYTGLKDINNKKIFEGDIVRVGIKLFENKKEYICKVIWQDFRALFALEFGPHTNNDLFKYVRNGNVLEVIGNIYENPEML